MVELLDTLDLGSSAARCEGWSPSIGTNIYLMSKSVYTQEVFEKALLSGFHGTKREAAIIINNAIKKINEKKDKEMQRVRQRSLHNL